MLLKIQTKIDIKKPALDVGNLFFNKPLINSNSAKISGSARQY